MDMNINTNNSPMGEVNNQKNIPQGYKEVTKEQFLKYLSTEEKNDKLTESLMSFVNNLQKSNDKRYPIITTGQVKGIRKDGKVTVQMIGDDSDVSETMGYLNQTPYELNENDYVKVCKQTGADKVNSWILAVNNINNKKDAMVFIEDCLQLILKLQEEINDLKDSIKFLSESYISTSVSIDGISVPTIKINGKKIDKSKSLLNQSSSVDNDVRIMQAELNKINQGKKNN